MDSKKQGIRLAGRILVLRPAKYGNPITAEGHPIRKLRTREAKPKKLVLDDCHHVF